MAESLSSEVSAILNAHPWRETLERLTLYAERTITYKRWRNSRWATPPKGIQSQDIVQTVIEKLFSNTRQWDPARHPDLYLWLKDQIDSEISNLAVSVENRNGVSESTLSDPGLLEGVEARTPENLLLKKEEESECDTFFLELLDFLSDEPILQKIVESFMAGSECTGKRSEFARSLGIPVSELDACKKRLSRRLRDFTSARVDMITTDERRGRL